MAMPAAVRKRVDEAHVASPLPEKTLMIDGSQSS
jgi:hypothetical protein